MKLLRDQVFVFETGKEGVFKANRIIGRIVGHLEIDEKDYNFEQLFFHTIPDGIQYPVMYILSFKKADDAMRFKLVWEDIE